MKSFTRAVLAVLLPVAVACAGTSDGATDGAADSFDVPGADSAPDGVATDLVETADLGSDAAADIATDLAAEGLADVPDDATVDPAADTPDDTSADTPVAACGAGGTCVEAGQACPASGMVLTQMGCTTTAGNLAGSCCIPGGGCQTDADCPDCLVCDLPAAGARTCVDPFKGGATQCTDRLDCPADNCCSYTLLAAKPLCHGTCMFDGGSADCHFCMGEGGEISGDVEKCCPGLEQIAMPMQFGDHCVPSRCFCDTCVKRCGDGVCTTGEDACRCPADCPHSFPQGPGSPCASDSDCASPGTCLTEKSGYPAGGYCTGGPCDPTPSMELCAAGSACTGTWFAQATLCMPTCRASTDCRAGLTCESFPEPYAQAGALRCWQAGGGQPAGLGQPCSKNADCISSLCLANAAGTQVCSAYCDATVLCREGLVCAPIGGCGSPSCGACFSL